MGFRLVWCAGWTCFLSLLVWPACVSVWIRALCLLPIHTLWKVQILQSRSERIALHQGLQMRGHLEPQALGVGVGRAGAEGLSKLRGGHDEAEMSLW